MLGSLEVFDQGEVDHKVLLIDTADPLAASLASAADVATLMPGVLEGLVEWLKYYKTTDGKAVNVLPYEEPRSIKEAAGLIFRCHDAWQRTYKNVTSGSTRRARDIDRVRSDLSVPRARGRPRGAVAR